MDRLDALYDDNEDRVAEKVYELYCNRLNIFP